ncbi:MAG: hypothetical protein RR540_04390 [Oscillospiraceae bacterium]
MAGKKGGSKANDAGKISAVMSQIPSKVFLEEVVKTILAIIIFLLFLVLFGSLAWLFISQYDASKAAGEAAVTVASCKNILYNFI